MCPHLPSFLSWHNIRTFSSFFLVIFRLCPGRPLVMVGFVVILGPTRLVAF